MYAHTYVLYMKAIHTPALVYKLFSNYTCCTYKWRCTHVVVSFLKGSADMDTVIMGHCIV